MIVLIREQPCASGSLHGDVRVSFERYRGMTVFSLPSSLPFPDVGNRRLRKTVNGSAMQFALHTRVLHTCTCMQGQMWARMSAHQQRRTRERLYVPAYVRILRVYCTGLLLSSSLSLSSSSLSSSSSFVVEHTRVG